MQKGRNEKIQSSYCTIMCDPEERRSMGSVSHVNAIDCNGELSLEKLEESQRMHNFDPNVQ